MEEGAGLRSRGYLTRVWQIDRPVMCDLPGKQETSPLFSAPIDVAKVLTSISIIQYLYLGYDLLPRSGAHMCTDRVIQSFFVNP